MKPYIYMRNNNDNNNELDTEILFVLESLGFPKEHLGTILYKEVIDNTIYYLNISNNEKEVEELKEQLSNPFSQFYFDIARNDNDMGLKSFHTVIKNAINENQNEDKIITESNYKEMSFTIGSMLQNKEIKAKKKLKK